MKVSSRLARPTIYALVGLLQALAANPANAADFIPAVTVIKKHVHLRVDSSGMETIEETLVARIERKDAVGSIANRRIDY